MQLINQSLVVNVCQQLVNTITPPDVPSVGTGGTKPPCAITGHTVPGDLVGGFPVLNTTGFQPDKLDITGILECRESMGKLPRIHLPCYISYPYHTEVWR